MVGTTISHCNILEKIGEGGLTTFRFAELRQPGLVLRSPIFSPEVNQ